MTPAELELAADRAWLAMLHDVHPMPAGVALDMVQEVCDERAAAVTALQEAACRSLVAYAPELVNSPSTDSQDAVAVRGRILGEPPAFTQSQNYDLAEHLTLDVRERNRNIRIAYYSQEPTVTDSDDARAAAWLRWTVYARRAIALLRAVSAAAKPNN